MKKGREPIPRHKSTFLLVRCPDCEEERILFSGSTKNVGCRKCGRVLAESRGGKAIIMATLVKKLG